MNPLSAASYLILLFTTAACYALFKAGQWEIALALIAIAAFVILKIESKISVLRVPHDGRMTPRMALRILVAFGLMCTFLCILIFGSFYVKFRSVKEKDLYREWCKKQDLYYYDFQNKHECRNSKTGASVPLPDVSSIREQLQ